MPPYKWVDNAELSVADQMTNITENTRPQSYLPLSKWKAKYTGSVQHRVRQVTSESVYMWDCSMLPRPQRPHKPKR